MGAGCFGNVFRVKSKVDNELYAVKIARETYRGNTDRAQKLEEVIHQYLAQFICGNSFETCFCSAGPETPTAFAPLELRPLLPELGREREAVPAV